MSETSTTTPQIALVTGATRGIGAAIAAELAERGYRVIGTATSDDGAARIDSVLSAKGGKGVKLDVTDGAAVDALIDAAEAKLRLEAEWTARLTAGEPIRKIFKLD